MTVHPIPALAAITLMAAPLAAAERKPDILVLLADDTGYNEVSFTGGNKRFPTPNLEALAANGVKFTHGYVSGAVCSPSRAGLLTGRNQCRFGHEFNLPPAYSETNGLPLTETLLPVALRDAGYRTVALGKWHLGYAPKFHPMERGFTDYHGFLQGSRSYFPLKSPGKLNRLLRDREPASEKFDYMTDEIARSACDYIAKTPDKPLFLYVAFNATHGPIQAKPEDLAAVGPGTPDAKLRAMTVALDRAVGTILDKLRAERRLDNALVFFLVDNGGASGRDNTPLRGHKGTLWEGGVRVPFLVSWPAALPKGKTYDRPVSALDIFPTALAAAGITKTPGLPLDGVNLRPHLDGTAAGRPHPTLYWRNGDTWAIRDGDLKLVLTDKTQNGRPALFDLAADPTEKTDLAAQKPETVARLAALHRAWCKDFPATPWGHGPELDLSGEGDDGEPAKKPAQRKKAR